MSVNDNFAHTLRRLKHSAAVAGAFILFGCVASLILLFIAPGAVVPILVGAVAWILLGLIGAAASAAIFAVYDAQTANASSARLEQRIAGLEKQVADRKAGLDAIANQYITLRTGLSEQIKTDSRRTEARLETLGDEIRRLSLSVEALTAEQCRIRYAAGAAHLGSDDSAKNAKQASDA